MSNETKSVPDEAISRVLNSEAPRATDFVVTVYGDVVEPRGGTLWMGTLIDTCAAQGISESLVRTSVSRLVASGRLEGDRRGRRSFYRLTVPARSEFVGVARLLFSPPPWPDRWLIRVGGAGALTNRHLKAGWAGMGAEMAIAADRPDLPRPSGILMSATAIEGVSDLPGFAAGHWNLQGVADAYLGFLDTFGPLADALNKGAVPDGRTSLALRLRLVNQYRLAMLADPRLPVAALPAEWAGHRARRLFVTLYLTLAATSDRFVGESFEDAGGALPAESEGTLLRLDSLKRELKGAHN